ncbi:hypothetical protein GCM10011504_43050 [Siccirubricoccus deserti]|nr:hypothetical protein GCM10011504_43050 [Siccirubricoccus deserti]
MGLRANHVLRLNLAERHLPKLSPDSEAALFTMILTAWAPRFNAWRLRAAR